MGANHSMDWDESSTTKNFVQSVKDTVDDELARRAMIRREVEMAVSIAKARDTVLIFGTVWGIFTTCLVTGYMVRRPIPVAATIPTVVGALVLGNIADMAYGNKLTRVVKEAEYILDNERGRFVPMRQSPFFKFYTDVDKASYYYPSTAVGDIFPNTILWPRSRTYEPSSKK
jgi:Uncharacterised conserved protein (DUF2368)